MSAVLALLLAPLVIGTGAAARAFWRQREAILLLGPLLLLALASRYLWTPPLIEEGPFGAATPAVAVDLIINLIAAAAVVVHGRAVHERSRAERVQWQSMESLRLLAEHIDDQAELESPLERARTLLAFGCEQFEVEIGLVARRGADRGFEILAVLQPPSDEAQDARARTISPKTAAGLGSTLVARAIASNTPIAVDRASQGHWSQHPSFAPFGFECFLGTRIDLADGWPAAICFASRGPRSTRFTGVDRSLLQLMAQWIKGSPAPEAARPRRPGLPPSWSSPAGEAAASGVDEAIEAMAQRLRSVLAQSASTPEAIPSLEVSLRAPDIRSRLDAESLEPVLRSLLLHLQASAGEGRPARIQIDTQIIRGPEEHPGSSFVALAVRCAEATASTEQLAAWQAGDDRPPNAPGLARVIRLLRSAGGDLSIEADQSKGGGGLSFTAYLPMVEDTRPIHSAKQPATQPATRASYLGTAP